MSNVAVQEDEYLDEVDSAAMDAIEAVRDTMIAAIGKIVIAQSKASVLYKPVLTRTNTAWKVVYGDFISYGNTPDVAMSNFDTQWSRRGINI